MKTFDTRIITKHDTELNWNLKPNFVPLNGEVIIYDDHERDSDNKPVPGFKVGNGVTPIADLAFVDAIRKAELLAHISNTDIHVTSQEKQFWNNKLNCDYAENTLTFNRN